MTKEEILENITGYVPGEIISISKNWIYQAMEEYATQQPLPEQADELKTLWHSLSNDEKEILGRPNFACGRIATRLREMGFACANKAEEEQALVIYVMLQFFKRNNSEWADKMNEYLRKMEVTNE